MQSEQVVKTHRQSLRRWVFIAILTLLLQPACFAAGKDLQVIDATSDYQQIEQSLFVLRDPTAKLKLEDILQDDIASRFADFTGVIPSFGHTTDAVWLRFTLDNVNRENLERILEVGIAWMDYITLYVIGPEGDIQKYHHSDLIPFSRRGIKHHLPVFTLSLASGQTTVLMHIKSVDAILVPISLWEPSVWKHQDRWNSLFYGALYGAVIVMIFYNGLLFLLLKAPAYFFYICYLAIFLTSNFTYNGFMFEILWPDQPLWIHWLDSALIYLFQVSGVMFVIHLLDTRKTSPGVHRFLIAYQIVVIAAFILTAIIDGYPLNTVTGINLIYVYSFILVVVGIISWLQGNRVARLLVIASISGFIGICLTASVALGLIPFNLISYHGADIGMLIDMTLLSMALADRYNILRDEKALVEHRYMVTLKEAKVNLEKEVEKQTSALRLEMEKAEQAARTDELTGMNNRRAFFEASTNAFSLARRHNHPISIIIMDIDKFKAINDTFGHGTGDIVLKMVGRNIIKSVRKTDVAGRIGGEEFALLLPQTTLKTAVDLAEKLRTIICQITVNHEIQKVHCSASFGVCQMQESDNSLYEFMARGDKAMYDAKASGRNRVVQDGLRSIQTLFQAQ